MKQFSAILLREWIQNRWGWSIVGLIPISIPISLWVFGSIGTNVGLTKPSTQGGWFAILSLGTAYVSLILALIAVVSQLSRRTIQDSHGPAAAFWRSFPVPRPLFAAANILMHLFVFPCFALLIGLCAGTAIALIAVPSAFSLTLPLGTDAAGAGLLVATGACRLVIGVFIGGLWALPFIATVMLAAVWVKGWSTPFIFSAAVVVTYLVKSGLDVPLPLASLGTIGIRSWQALMPGSAPGSTGLHPEQIVTGQFQIPTEWIFNDLRARAFECLDPLMLYGLIWTVVVVWVIGLKPVARH
jgi:hypothetical protein